MPQQNTQQYFEPLRNIHQREYPIPQDELSVIVGQAMNGLDLVANRVKVIRNNLSPEEQARADSFLFYVDTLREKNVSPITVSAETYTKDKKILLERLYNTDIQFERGLGWNGIFGEGFPELKWNNLWSRFFKNYFYYGLDGTSKYTEEKILEYIDEWDIDEHKGIILEKFRKRELLNGDRHFGSSQFKLYLWHINQCFKQGDISTKPSEEEIERAKAELADKNILAYIDLQGREVRPNKTRYEAWNEFRTENPEHFQRLVELCNLPYEQRKPLHGELYPLVDKAFTLLRVKGFNAYPDLTG